MTGMHFLLISSELLHASDTGSEGVRLLAKIDELLDFD